MMTKILPFVLLAGCTSASPLGDPAPSTVREHLESPTRMFASPGTSGALTAKRWTRDGWHSAEVPLVIENGEIDASVDAAGQLVINDLQIAFAPIDIPEGTIGSAARLEHLRLDPKVPPSPASTVWNGDDAATATTTLELALAWSVTIDEVTTALGPQTLPPITAQFSVGGSGEVVEATLAMEHEGTLWSWLDVIELENLHLSVDATSR